MAPTGVRRGAVGLAPGVGLLRAVPARRFLQLGDKRREVGPDALAKIFNGDQHPRGTGNRSEGIAGSAVCLVASSLDTGVALPGFAGRC